MSPRLHPIRRTAALWVAVALTGAALLAAAAGLLAPPPAYAEEGALHVVVLDPGHGGYDGGLDVGGEFREKEVTLKVSQALQSVLRGQRRKVFLTRSTDQHLSIDRRISITAENRPDLFISIHMTPEDRFNVYIMDYPENRRKLPAEKYYSLEGRQAAWLSESRALGSEITNVLGKEFGMPARVESLPLPLLGSMNVPAIIIEVPATAIDYQTDLDRLAYSISIGIENHERK